MKIVVSYDDYDGTVLAYSDEEKTVPMDVNYVLKGHIQMLSANIDDNKKFDHIDVTKTPNEIILKDKPKSQLTEISEELNINMDTIVAHEVIQDKNIKNIQNNILKINNSIDGLIKNIQDLKGGDA